VNVGKNDNEFSFFR
jgi:hypothetical protein